MGYKNYYKVLGLKKNATANEIKSAYRTLSFIYHPDKATEDFILENKFKEINEAYHNLIDENKRLQYDLKYKSQSYKPNALIFWALIILILLVVFLFIVWYISHLVTAPVIVAIV